MYLLDASSIHLKVDLAKASECASQSSQENARLEQLVQELQASLYSEKAAAQRVHEVEALVSSLRKGVLHSAGSCS